MEAAGEGGAVTMVISFAGSDSLGNGESRSAFVCSCLIPYHFHCLVYSLIGRALL